MKLKSALLIGFAGCCTQGCTFPLDAQITSVEISRREDPLPGLPEGFATTLLVVNARVKSDGNKENWMLSQKCGGESFYNMIGGGYVKDGVAENLIWVWHEGGLNNLSYNLVRDPFDLCVSVFRSNWPLPGYRSHSVRVPATMIAKVLSEP
jgi:hypothetical protein